ncbi:virulence factor [Staphylococcus felis]|uniref:virulence factor n=1 Tax=Staphylococcus felis TaxID=46127 RepID=UPI000CD267D7|nr:virulence factor [Staphylococcus felis]AVP37051.1 virulence factor [Staphylococcus felis]PNZ35659.1 virulence factor [Staphylococcus felis]QQB02997.1 conserved virulence factor C family protein [Staphylococcus felis]REH93319.1 virulence factor [Staphylococcus felis]
MEVIKVEPTPSPNTMKIVLSKTREDNKSQTYSEIKDANPNYINTILNIEGVKSIFHVMDFIAVDKKPRADWEQLLPKITASLNGKALDMTQHASNEHFGEVQVQVLTFKQIPYQIKLMSSLDESRLQLEDRFVNAMLKVQKPDDNVIFLRKWVDLGVRYGEMDDILKDVEDEINAMYPNDTLESLVEQALESDTSAPIKTYEHVSLSQYQSAKDWKMRLNMLKQFPTPTKEDYKLLDWALTDEKVPIRREAIVLLGMVEDRETLPYLYKGLNDKSPAVRRTAGDCISDLGFKDALPEMEKALSDPQKIVRWRAAMFIFDEGSTEQLNTLKQHQNDPAYEVKLQVQMAIERIENGEKALGSVWKQIANRNQ